jgi:DHA1 family inner membrane transport protein
MAEVFPGMLPAVIVLLGIWSIAHTAGVTLSQVRVTMAGDRAPAFAMTLNISCANLGIAAGAFTGGWAIDRWGLAAIGWTPIAFAALVVVLSALLVCLAPHRPAPVEQRCESVG